VGSNHRIGGEPETSAQRAQMVNARDERSKIRNPNIEIRNKSERSEMLKLRKRFAATVSLFSDFYLFEFVSDFGFRVSDFRAKRDYAGNS
jgi:hypothetical protein